ncbi:hypothetical protein Ddye_021952 [Dipteronia dyeriana]|uniref:Uncharacterized protein n=1 Tax=Dipteronia dyeriana TaxID=168575 RepID=A0AAD9WY72_9ROSI|nr:hypothetical protein Ddye_021952 [Dipteronia dyeriana]
MLISSLYMCVITVPKPQLDTFVACKSSNHFGVEIGTEEIVNEVRKVKRQNLSDDCSHNCLPGDSLKWHSSSKLRLIKVKNIESIVDVAWFRCVKVICFNCYREFC